MNQRSTALPSFPFVRAFNLSRILLLVLFSTCNYRPFVEAGDPAFLHACPSLPVGTKEEFSRRQRANMATKRNNDGEGRIPIVALQPPRPHDSCYWVTDSFMAGEYPTHRSNNEEKTREKLRNYLKYGITYFIDLTREGEKPSYENWVREEASKLDLGDKLVVKRFGINDFDVPDSPSVMKEILDTIDVAIEKENHKVYVHCRGGIGRTGTTVGCYLARHGYTGEDALKEVNRLFKNSDRSRESYYSPETEDQMNFVREWNEK
jgi:protein-tyrosine phosphatase